MDRITWLQRLVETAEHFESREYQQRSWLGLGPEVSSPDELYCQFFDDYTAALFHQTFSREFSNDQERVWRDFVAALEHYEARNPGNLDARRVLEDPNWEHVREAARRFVRTFGNA